jgi:putative membrane protein
MENKKTIKDAFFKSPGPDTTKDAVILFLKGIAMGSADIIPGVSGGTIALITGIYGKVLSAIKSFNISALKKLLKLDIKGAIEETHLRFVIVLFSGIALAILTLARLMNFLLKNHPEPTFSLFFGLIAASIYIVAKQVKWKAPEYIAILIGTAFAYLIVGLIPVETPKELWFIFLSGVVAISAMILPGLSGAFILLILGKYEFITGTLKAPFSMNEQIGISNLIIIIVFCAGCGLGLAGFARFLNWLLSKWQNLTLAFLTGLMAGSMRKIWPWKGEAVVQIIRDKEHVVSQANVFPSSFSGYVALCVFLMLAGVVVIVVLDKLSNKKSI